MSESTQVLTAQIKTNIRARGYIYTMSKTKDEVMRMFNKSSRMMWDQTGRFDSDIEFDDELVYTQDINLRVLLEKQNDRYTPDYLPEDQLSVYNYKLTIYYNKNPVKSFNIFRTNSGKGCIIVTDDITTNTLSQENFNQMKDLNEKFTDVQLNFEQFVNRDLNMTVED